MKLRVLAAAVAAAGTLGVAFAQQPPAKHIGVFQLGPFRQISSADYAFTDIYFLSNGGAASLAVMTSAGPVLLDAKQAGWGAAVQAGLRQITEQPVAAIVATHAHEDHAGAIGEYPAPVQVVMHENTASRLKGRTGAATVKTFLDQATVPVGDVTLRLYYFGKGHTDGDAFVVVPTERTGYAGDLVMEKAVPVIDVASGGSALALPQTLARAVAEITDVDYVITGHVPAPASRARTWATWKDFVHYAEFTREFVDGATAAFKGGRTIDQAVSELSTLQAKYKDYNLAGAKATIEVIFSELRQDPTAVIR